MFHSVNTLILLLILIKSFLFLSILWVLLALVLALALLLATLSECMPSAPDTTVCVLIMLMTHPLYV